MSDQKYTLGESALVFGLGGLMIMVVMILLFPLALLTAWMRETIWNWYAPWWHLPHVTIWQMWLAGTFVAMFMPTYPELKDDLMKFKSWQRSMFLVLGQVVAFALIAIVHIWIKP